MAKQDGDLIAITPAMREGSGLVNFSREFPERFFDVAIAEQHAVTLAAGMACEDKKPVVAIYSTFLQRAYDQLIHDVALQNLNVLFAIDRAGLVGEDGPTHSGNYDLTYLRCIPNMIIAVPADENETRKLLTTAFMHQGPAAVRYPRGGGINSAIELELNPLEVGKGRVISKKQSEILVLNFGALIATSQEVAEELDATLLDMRFVKPLDEDLITEHSKDKKIIITIEDGAISGGAGSAVNEWSQENKIKSQIVICGIPDKFIEHAAEIYKYRFKIMTTRAQQLEAFDRLLTIMDELREHCPWDQKQTMETLRPLTIEETYELGDAILDADLQEVKNELGDLLLHIVFYAKIGSETSDFDISHVINSICDKLIHRHPHIYSDVEVKDETEVKQNWENLKLREGKTSVLQGVPKSLPALVKASRIQEKVAGIGFDWEHADQVWEKVEEELGELKAEIQNKNQDAIEDEFGDVLFSLINYARAIDVNPENALERTNKKFTKRFQYLERKAKSLQKSLSEMTLAEMDVYWEEAKKL